MVLDNSFDIVFRKYYDSIFNLVFTQNCAIEIQIDETWDDFNASAVSLASLSVNEWMNAWMNECMHACMNEWMNACMHEWMNEWINQSINQSTTHLGISFKKLQGKRLTCLVEQFIPKGPTYMPRCTLHPGPWSCWKKKSCNKPIL